MTALPSHPNPNSHPTTHPNRRIMRRQLGLGVLLALLASIGAEAFLVPAGRPSGITSSWNTRGATRLFGILEDVNVAVKDAMKSKQKVSGRVVDWLGVGFF